MIDRKHGRIKLILSLQRSGPLHEPLHGTVDTHPTQHHPAGTGLRESDRHLPYPYCQTIWGPSERSMKERIEDQAECRHSSKRQHRRALCRVTQQQYIVNDAPCANASPSRLESLWDAEALIQGVPLPTMGPPPESARTAGTAQ
jgi:hypothetical protein